MKRTFILILGFWFLWNFSNVFASCDFSNSTFEQERTESYFWACEEWIISDWTITSAKMDKELTRIEMAKMLNIFSMKIMWNEEDPSKNCNWYSDLTNYSDISTASRACHLWIMWIWIDKFRPNDFVSRAEFGTVLSRILYWDKYNVSEWEYYKLHLQALKDNWIITNDNPNIKEMKWYVLLMLKRYIDKIKTGNKNIEDSITLKNDNWYIAIIWNDVTLSNFKNTITVNNKIEKTLDWKWSSSLQWPCAPWYHVPSKDEAIELINIWWDIRKEDLQEATINSWQILQQWKEYDFRDNAAWFMFLSDIYWREINMEYNKHSHTTYFWTRSKTWENSPYSITAQVRWNYWWSDVSVWTSCWMQCEKIGVLCFKTK